MIKSSWNCKARIVDALRLVARNSTGYKPAVLWARLIDETATETKAALFYLVGRCEADKANNSTFKIFGSIAIETRQRVVVDIPAPAQCKTPICVQTGGPNGYCNTCNGFLNEVRQVYPGVDKLIR